MIPSKTTQPPRIGAIVAFRAAAAPHLAGVPAVVIAVSERFRSGEYLLTLEYGEPVKHQGVLVRHLDAFTSEVEAVRATAVEVGR